MSPPGLWLKVVGSWQLILTVRYESSYVRYTCIKCIRIRLWRLMINAGRRGKSE